MDKTTAPTQPDSTPSEELDEDVRSAVERCKDHQRQQVGAAADPPVFVIETCGEVAVCMPHAFTQYERLQKLQLQAVDDKTKFPRYIDTYVAESLFWVKGQRGEGPRAATEYARSVRNSHFSKFNLFTALYNEISDQISALQGETVSAKKY